MNCVQGGIGKTKIEKQMSNDEKSFNKLISIRNQSQIDYKNKQKKIEDQNKRINEKQEINHNKRMLEMQNYMGNYMMINRCLWSWG